MCGFFSFFLFFPEFNQEEGCCRVEMLKETLCISVFQPAAFNSYLKSGILANTWIFIHKHTCTNRYTCMCDIYAILHMHIYM